MATCPCYTSDTPRAYGYSRGAIRKCEVTLKTPLDLSAIIGINTTVALQTSPVIYQPGEQILVNTTLDKQFIFDIKPMKSTPYNGKKTALSWLYASMMIANTNFITNNNNPDASIIAPLTESFLKIRCFIIEEKNLSYESSQYLINVSKLWYTCVLSYIVDLEGQTPTVTRPTDIVYAYNKLIGIVNNHFACVENKFLIV
jgi:hypothetical protein